MPQPQQEPFAREQLSAALLPPAHAAGTRQDWEPYRASTQTGALQQEAFGREALWAKQQGPSVLS